MGIPVDTPVRHDMTRHDDTAWVPLRVFGTGKRYWRRKTRTEESKQARHETDRVLNYHGSVRAISSDKKGGVVINTSSSIQSIVTMTKTDTRKARAERRRGERDRHRSHVLRTHRRRYYSRAARAPVGARSRRDLPEQHLEKRNISPTRHRAR